MAARKPEDCHRLFAETFSAGNLDALMALYEPRAHLVPQPGQPAVSGPAARDALQRFLTLKPSIRIDTLSVVQAADIALLRSKWTLTGTGPDGKPITMANRGTEVVRRQPDGTWRFVVDQPFCADE